MKSHEQTHLVKTESVSFKRALLLKSCLPSEGSSQWQTRSSDRKKAFGRSRVGDLRSSEHNVTLVKSARRCEPSDVSDLCLWSGVAPIWPALNGASSRWSRKQPPWRRHRLFAQQQIVSHMAALQREVVQHHVGRPSDPWRGVNPVFFSVLLPKLRYGCYSAHVILAWGSTDLEKLNRHFTDVWLIGKRVSKQCRSDLVTKQAAVRGFSRGRWQIESTLKIAPKGISSF